MKKGKSAGLDGIYGEMIRMGAGVIVDWLVRGKSASGVARCLFSADI